MWGDGVWVKQVYVSMCVLDGMVVEESEPYNIWARCAPCSCPGPLLVTPHSSLTHSPPHSLEYECPHCVQLHTDEGLQGCGAVPVKELNLLHQQRPEQLHAECGQHLLPCCYHIHHVDTRQQWLQQVAHQQDAKDLLEQVLGGQGVCV